MYGLPPEQVRPGMTLREIVQLRIANGLYAGATPDDYMGERTARVTQASNTVQQLSDGRFIAIARRPMACGGWVTTHEDITEQRKAEAQIAYMAHHDALTGLPNRTLLRLRLDEALARAQRGEALAVLCLDLDRFKEVNDTLGHAVGDALLKAVAERLKGCIRETDTVGRASGDEFVIVQSPVQRRPEAMALAKRIVEVMQRAVRALRSSGHGRHERRHRHGAARRHRSRAAAAQRRPRSVSGQERAARHLPLLRARHELAPAWRAAIWSWRCATPCRTASSRSTTSPSSISSTTRCAASRRCCAGTGRSAALSRRPSSSRWPRKPGSSRRSANGSCVQACAQAASWPDAHHGLRQSFGGAVQEPQSGADRRQCAGVLGPRARPARARDHRVDPGAGQRERARHAATTCATSGVKIALDDFGTGYSSLSYLQSFPFDKIKIDRSFIKDLECGNENALAIVSAVVQLGRTLGMATTAEGVETSDQLEIVRAKGCTEIQGYLLSPPKPPMQMQQFCAGPSRRAPRPEHVPAPACEARRRMRVRLPSGLHAGPVADAARLRCFATFDKPCHFHLPIWLRLATRFGRSASRRRLRDSTRGDPALGIGAGSHGERTGCIGSASISAARSLTLRFTTRSGGKMAIHKRLTTPHDPSEAVLDGVETLIARERRRHRRRRPTSSTARRSSPTR